MFFKVLGRFRGLAGCPRGWAPPRINKKPGRKKKSARFFLIRGSGYSAVGHGIDVWYAHAATPLVGASSHLPFGLKVNPKDTLTTTGGRKRGHGVVALRGNSWKLIFTLARFF